MLQSCATLVGGRTNTLVIEGNLPDSVQVYLDDNLIGMAPNKIKLDSRLIQHGSILTIKDKDKVIKEQMLIRRPNSAYMIIDAFMGGIPLGVDYATGHIHRPYPRKIVYGETVENK